jgi:hypothetical protein
VDVAPPDTLGTGTQPSSVGETISLSVADTFISPGSVSLNCRTDAQSNVVYARQLRIAAIPVAKLTIADLNSSYSLTSGSGSPEAIWSYSSKTTTVTVTGSGESGLLNLPRGFWAAFGTAQIQSVSAGAYGECSPHGSGGGSGGQWSITSAGTAGDIQSVSAEYQSDLSNSPGVQGMVCDTYPATVVISNITLSALREGTVSFSYSGHITGTKGSGTPIAMTGYRLYRQPIPMGTPQRLWGPMHLGAGNWLVSTDFDTLIEVAGSPAIVRCQLRAGTHVIDVAVTRLEPGLVTGHPRQSIALLDVVPMSGPHAVTVACGHSGTSLVKIANLVINAIKVGPLTVAP